MNNHRVFCAFWLDLHKPLRVQPWITTENQVKETEEIDVSPTLCCEQHFSKDANLDYRTAGQRRPCLIFPEQPGLCILFALSLFKNFWCFFFSRNTRDQSKCYSEMLWGAVSLFHFSRLWRTVQRELVHIWTWGSIEEFDKHPLTWIVFSGPSGISSKLLQLVPCDSKSILALKSEPCDSCLISRDPSVSQPLCRKFHPVYLSWTGVVSADRALLWASSGRRSLGNQYEGDVAVIALWKDLCLPGVGPVSCWLWYSLCMEVGCVHGDTASVSVFHSLFHSQSLHYQNSCPVYSLLWRHVCSSGHPKRCRQPCPQSEVRLSG